MLKSLLNIIKWFAVVFLIVLALHILVIGGFTVYYLMHPYHLTHP